MPRKIILDVDTGSDDAVAIMLAALSESIEVIGICSVNGNRNIDFTTKNSLRVVDYLGLNIPVYRGCSLPMVSTLIAGRRPNIPYNGPGTKEEDVHGDDLPLPKTAQQEQPQHAVFWLIDTLLNAKEKLTIVAVGPLTNIAMALRLEPKITKNIEEIVIMGGGYLINNITSGAEFNFWVDPEAAKIVLDCGCKICMVPLDATHAAYVSEKDAEDMRALGTPAAKFCAEMIQQRMRGYNIWHPLPVPNTVPVHDALAVCYLINPEVLESVMHVNVDVCISVGAADGLSLCDVEGRDKTRKPNAYVARSANRELFLQILKETFGKSH